MKNKFNRSNSIVMGATMVLILSLGASAFANDEMQNADKQGLEIQNSEIQKESPKDSEVTKIENPSVFCKYMEEGRINGGYVFSIDNSNSKKPASIKVWQVGDLKESQIPQEGLELTVKMVSLPRCMCYGYMINTESYFMGATLNHDMELFNIDRPSGNPTLTVVFSSPDDKKNKEVVIDKDKFVCENVK